MFHNKASQNSQHFEQLEKTAQITLLVQSRVGDLSWLNGKEPKWRNEGVGCNNNTSNIMLLMVGRCKGELVLLMLLRG